MSSSAFTALALRVVGFVLILVPVLNLILGFFPPKFEDIQWQLAASSQIVDQSLMPLVGVVLLVGSFWVDHVAQSSGRNSPIARTLTFGFASLMGLILVLTIPLQINNVHQLQTKAEKALSQSFDENQPQFKKTVEDTVTRQRQGIQMLMQNPQQLQAGVQSGQVTPEQAKLVDQFRANPGSLDEFLKGERQNIEKQLKAQMANQKQAETDKLKEGWKTLIRACISSFAIAIAFITIGWNGFRKVVTID